MSTKPFVRRLCPVRDSVLRRPQLQNRGRLAEKRTAPTGTEKRSGLGNGRRRATVGLPASGYTDHVHELQALIAQTQQQAQQLQRKINMESTKKRTDNSKSPEPEKKRESRLTSIIDQLLSNKAKGLGGKELSGGGGEIKPAVTDRSQTNHHQDDVDPQSDDNSNHGQRELKRFNSRESVNNDNELSSVTSSTSSESGQSEISTGSTSSVDPNVPASPTTTEETHHDNVSEPEGFGGTTGGVPEATASDELQPHKDTSPAPNFAPIPSPNRIPRKKQSRSLHCRPDSDDNNGTANRSAPATPAQFQVQQLVGSSSCSPSKSNATFSVASSVNGCVVGAGRSGACAEPPSLLPPGHHQPHQPQPQPQPQPQQPPQQQICRLTPDRGTTGSSLGMPADTLLFDPAKIKSERFTPDSAGSSPSPSRSPAATLAGIRAAVFPHHSAPSPGLADHFPAPLLATPPVLKQMEQMVTRNYSDIMRSLAAKYNNSNPDRYNGLERKFDGRFPTPPLLGLANKDNEGARRNENHSAPPVLGEPRPGSAAGASTPGSTSSVTGVGMSMAGLAGLGLMDMSSTQALLSMVRSASAQSASQLETYLRGALKRPGGGGDHEPNRADPLDLTVSSKRPRVGSLGDSVGLGFDSAAAMAATLNMQLPGGATVGIASPAAVLGKQIRDFRDLLGSLKQDTSETEVHLPCLSTHPQSFANLNSLGLSSSNNNKSAWPGTRHHHHHQDSHRSHKTESLHLSTRASKSTASSPSNSASPASSATSSVASSPEKVSLPCYSMCTDRPCADSSEASTIVRWTVTDVCNFIASIDTCSEYIETFREQSIDGASLPLLTEEHLINNMNMKLGPALKLRAALAKKIGHCAICMHCIHCHGSANADQQRRPEST